MLDPVRSSLVERSRAGFLEHITWQGSDFRVSAGEEHHTISAGAKASILFVGDANSAVFELEPPRIAKGEMLVMFEGAWMATIPQDGPWQPLDLPSRESIQQRFRRSVADLLRYDHALLSRDINERTITARIGFYLQNEFSDWHVDCEYNRAVSLSGRNAMEIKAIAIWQVGVEKYAQQAGLKVQHCFPDIIVHRRESCCNLLVVEVKKHDPRPASHRERRSEDLKRLHAFRNQLGYREGVFLALSTGSHLKVQEETWLPHSHCKPGGPLCGVEFIDGDRLFFSAGSDPIK